MQSDWNAESSDWNAQINRECSKLVDVAVELLRRCGFEVIRKSGRARQLNRCGLHAVGKIDVETKARVIKVKYDPCSHLDAAFVIVELQSDAAATSDARRERHPVKIHIGQ